MSNIVAMAIDQSPNHTGWAIGKPMDPKILFGKFPLPPWGDDEPARVYAYKLWLDGMLDRHGVTHLFYERPVPAAGLGKAVTYVPTRGANAGKVRARVVNQKDPNITDNQASVKTIIWLCAAEHRIPVNPIDVNHMRLHFIGRSSVPGLQGEAHTNELKSLAMKACAQAMLLPEDHNVAEAIGHLDFALSTLDRGHARKSLLRMERKINDLTYGREA